MVKETAVLLTGMDISENGIANAKLLAKNNHLENKMEFILGDASQKLSFEDESFDVVLSIDSINHLHNRPAVLKEFRRVLKKGGRLLYTDPVVITGIVTNEELAVRSSIGYFLFVPLGENERLLSEAGFVQIKSEDVTANIALTSQNWLTARQSRKDALLQSETLETFEGLQAFAAMVYLLTSERRLSRIMYHAVKH